MAIDVKYLINFIGVHFLDLNPNSYDRNKVKLDLNASKPKIKFITNV